MVWMLVLQNWKCCGPTMQRMNKQRRLQVITCGKSSIHTSMFRRIYQKISRPGYRLFRIYTQWNITKQIPQVISKPYNHLKAFMHGFVSILEHSSGASIDAASDDEMSRPNQVPPYFPNIYDFAGFDLVMTS